MNKNVILLLALCTLWSSIRAMESNRPPSPSHIALTLSQKYSVSSLKLALGQASLATARLINDPSAYSEIRPHLTVSCQATQAIKAALEHAGPLPKKKGVLKILDLMHTNILQAIQLAPNETDPFDIEQAARLLALVSSTKKTGDNLFDAFNGSYRPPKKDSVNQAICSTVMQHPLAALECIYQQVGQKTDLDLLSRCADMRSDLIAQCGDSTLILQDLSQGNPDEQQLLEYVQQVCQWGIHVSQICEQIPLDRLNSQAVLGILQAPIISTRIVCASTPVAACETIIAAAHSNQTGLVGLSTRTVGSLLKKGISALTGQETIGALEDSLANPVKSSKVIQTVHDLIDQYELRTWLLPTVIQILKNHGSSIDSAALQVVTFFKDHSQQFVDTHEAVTRLQERQCAPSMQQTANPFGQLADAWHRPPRAHNARIISWTGQDLTDTDVATHHFTSALGLKCIAQEQELALLQSNLKILYHS